MERCPVCRARLSTPLCRRCGADYAPAYAAAQQAQQEVREALSLWARGYLETAAQLLQHSLQCKQDAVVVQLLDCLLQKLSQQAVQHLLNDDSVAAEHLCRVILAIKFMPLIAQLHAFLQTKNQRQSVTNLVSNEEHLLNSRYLQPYIFNHSKIHFNSR